MKTAPQLRKLGTTQLEKYAQKTTGLELNVINSILEVRRAKKKAKEAPEVQPKKAPKILEDSAISKATEAMEKAKMNVGKEVSFKPFRSTENITGVIKSVWIDKRVAEVLYKIACEDGAIKNKCIKHVQISK